MEFPEPINSAVNYWAKFLENGPSIDNIGDPIADMLMTMVKLNNETTNNATQVEVFKNALGSHIQSVFDRGGTWISFGVDYGPDMELISALQSAKIKSSPFPSKTNMWITPDKVSVSQGYRAPERVLWEASPKNEE